MIQYAIRNIRDGRFVLKSAYSHELELTLVGQQPRTNTYTALFADERNARTQRTRLINHHNKGHYGRVPEFLEDMGDWEVVQVKVTVVSA